MKNLILENYGDAISSYLSQFVDLESRETLVVASSNPFNISNSARGTKAIVNLVRVNDIRYINKYFEAANAKLENGCTFIVCFETIQARRSKLQIGRIPIIKSIYFAFEFLLKRVAPKVWGLKRIYFFITKGKNRHLSKAEVLGRLVSTGFRIAECSNIDGLTFAVTEKIKEPDFNMNPSYGPLFTMQRVGKNGKMFGVYKFRTMHPFAEYLQDYILNQYGYAESGKPKNDFRLTPWGKVMRKYWIDELPQLINVLKGEMKLVGVRPVSKRYMEDIPEELRALRLRHKPGCIPPYVSLNRKSSVEEVLKAETEYLLEKERRPYTTDTRYFFKAIFNIVIKRKRSA
jgi:lipopolysaccharide/colanic/teichoic acid biosynthesis glycosyltransferase